MRYLADSNILLRIVKPDDRDYALVRSALEALWSHGEEICYTPQNLAEFWNVCTRPAEKNGFSLTTEEADQRAQIIERTFTLLPDSEHVHQEWRRLVVAHSVKGAQVYDARLVAAMKAHGITHLLTLNARDFARYSEITAIPPQQLG